MEFSAKWQVMSYILNTENLTLDSLKTFEVIDAESPIVIFFGTYGSSFLLVLHVCHTMQSLDISPLKFSIFSVLSH